MDEKKETKFGPETLLEMWLKNVAEFSESAGKFWEEASSGGHGQGDSESDKRSRALDSFATSMKTFSAMAATMKEPEALESLFKGINAFPEVVSKLMKPAMEGFFRMQKEFVDRAGRIGKSTAAYNFENLDQEAFRGWLEIYEQEFRKFLHMPQLGLTRGYQERVSEAADKFNIFQATAAEFASLLLLPMEKSFKVMQEQMAVMADEGNLPDKSKELYRMWVKVLEGHYMTLFKSPEYNEALRRILSAMGEYNVARQEILQDALHTLPVPTLKEMDELYKEIYLLKKRVRELESKINDDGEDFAAYS